jgi:hypothetical protein
MKVKCVSVYQVGCVYCVTMMHGQENIKLKVCHFMLTSLSQKTWSTQWLVSMLLAGVLDSSCSF